MQLAQLKIYIAPSPGYRILGMYVSDCQQITMPLRSPLHMMLGLQLR